MTGQQPGTRGGRARAYAIALAALVGAIMLRGLLDPLMGEALPLVTLFGAVAIAVWAGGYQPAIVVAVVGFGVASFLFIEPRGHLGLENVGHLVGLFAYLFTCALIIGFGEMLRAARASESRQRELLRVTLRSIGDAVITTDTDARVTYLNEAARSLTGWTDQDAIGQPLGAVFRVLDEKTRQPIEDPAARALREGGVVGLANHTLLLRRDGSERAIDDSASPIQDEAGRVSGCVLIFRDVTEQRRAQQDRIGRLLAARELGSIVESSDDAIISKTLDGVIRSWNAAAERLFGHTAEQAVGRHISLIIPPERQAEEDHIITRLKAGQRIEHFETERVRRDGAPVLVSLTISPIKDDDGNVVGASKTARDVTERKRMEDHLRQLAADLAQADRRKDEFLATLAHELRNPLAPIANMLHVLKRADGDAPARARARDVIERQLAQLVRLVDDLLDVSRITHNRLELRKSRVELGAVIEQAVESSRHLADSAQHELEVRLPGEPVLLEADLARLAQVFGNLLNNACRYTSPGGRILMSAARDGSDVVVTVADTGSGIPADKLDGVFEMFTQLDRPLERSHGGLGIGLTLVKRLVEMHGGSIRARSAGEGKGSEFVVRLPALPHGTAPATTPVATESSPAPPRSRRILVVDDNPDSAESLALLLKMTGNEMHTAHDGHSALETAEQRRPEVVLLDIGLPGLSGYDVCRRIREQPWGKQIVLIALTGWGQDADRQRSKEAGFDDHLVKPVDPVALAKLIGALASQRDAGAVRA